MIKRTAFAALGFLPFVGAIASLLWMMWASAPPGGLDLLGLCVRGSWAIVAFQAFYAALQSVLWQRYRNFKRPAGSTLPRVTVVIPAFNEGAMVERSIRGVGRSDYPRELLDIIVVDDGSRDDTFFHMQHLRREFPDLVKLVRFAGNRGKRAALDAGFRAATGEIVVTIDSDSEIEPQTISEIVAPFLADPEVGAVAGRVAVLNRDTIISCMLDVQFALAFDFARAVQSTYGAVSCCPGALSAFRREIILPHLEEWTNQTFLGRPVNHGEDQALTNIVLRLGYQTVYQRSAVIHTIAPTTYRQLSRMFTRWDRSYVVEGFAFAKFMFTRYRTKNRVLPIIAFVASSLRLLLLVALPLVFTQQSPTVINSVIALSVGALFSAAYYLRIERSFRFAYGVLYAVFSLLFLQWILPWAVITVRDERWGTR
jgi:hyaluronan synthase